MTQPKGVNVEPVDYEKLDDRDIRKLLQALMEHLDLELWIDTTPNYCELIITKNDSLVRRL